MNRNYSISSFYLVFSICSKRGNLSYLNKNCVPEDLVAHTLYDIATFLSKNPDAPEEFAVIAPSRLFTEEEALEVDLIRETQAALKSGLSLSGGDHIQAILQSGVMIMKIEDDGADLLRRSNLSPTEFVLSYVLPITILSPSNGKVPSTHLLQLGLDDFVIQTLQQTPLAQHIIDQCPDKEVYVLPLDQGKLKGYIKILRANFSKVVQE